MADCTCRYERPHWAFSPQWAEFLVWRDPRCPIHYAPVPQYDQAGRLRPITERFPPEMKVG